MSNRNYFAYFENRNIFTQEVFLCSKRTFFSDKTIFTTELFIRLTYKEVILLKFSIFSPLHQSLYNKF
jgi:hypothetical protein